MGLQGSSPSPSCQEKARGRRVGYCERGVSPVLCQRCHGLPATPALRREPEEYGWADRKNIQDEEQRFLPGVDQTIDNNHHLAGGNRDPSTNITRKQLAT